MYSFEGILFEFELEVDTACFLLPGSLLPGSLDVEFNAPE
jgi:hypothetical protein